MEVLTRKFADSALRITCGDDLPDVLPYGVAWSELNLLIYPGKETTPMFRVGPPEYFDKEATWHYLRAFFPHSQRDELWLHVWQSRVKTTTMDIEISKLHFTQERVDQIVARAKELGAGEGLTHKQGLFQISAYGTDAFGLAMCLVNGWSLQDDLITAFYAAAHVLGPDVVFKPSDLAALTRRAAELGASVEGEVEVEPDESNWSYGFYGVAKVLVTRYLAHKYDLIYALQALIEHCVQQSNSRLIQQIVQTSQELEQTEESPDYILLKSLPGDGFIDDEVVREALVEESRRRNLHRLRSTGQAHPMVGVIGAATPDSTFLYERKSGGSLATALLGAAMLGSGLPRFLRAPELKPPQSDADREFYLNQARERRERRAAKRAKAQAKAEANSYKSR